MNRPAFPQGSLTAEDRKWIAQDEAVEARQVHAVTANYYRDLLAAKNAIARRKAKIQEGVLIVAGGLFGAACFVFVLPLVMVALRP